MDGAGCGVISAATRTLGEPFVSTQCVIRLGGRGEENIFAQSNRHSMVSSPARAALGERELNDETWRGRTLDYSSELNFHLARIFRATGEGDKVHS